MQRQRRLRSVMLWFVRSVATVSVLSFAISGRVEVTVYLLFMVLPVSIVTGLTLTLMIAPIVSLIRRSWATGLRLSRSMLESSILAAMIVAAISFHLIGEPLLEELARPEEAGDSLLGLTYQGLVLVYAVLPASLLGSILAGILEQTQK